eukprot:3501620-Ditylum_brightwellii.AAC.1
MGLTEYGYLQVPDNVWARDLSEEENKFVITYNSKIRHKEDISGLNVPHKFKLVITIKKGEISRRRIGFNLDPELQEGVEEE